MKTFLSLLLLLAGALLVPASSPAQTKTDNLPAALAAAKTVAIINDTHNDDVAAGAADAVRAWGRFKVIDDPDTADVTMRFDKSKNHEGKDSDTVGTDGSPSHSYSMSFSTSIHMKVYLKDADSPLYATKTDDSKRRAGMSCVSDLRRALQAAGSQ